MTIIVQGCDTLANSDIFADLLYICELPMGLLRLQWANEQQLQNLSFLESGELATSVLSGDFLCSRACQGARARPGPTRVI